MKVKCAFCKSDTNKVEKTDAIRIDEKNFHPECAKKYSDRKELYDTICRIFNLKKPGPKNIRFAERFVEEGMTYSGINGTLIYFYEIKKHSKNKANEGIGIVPWVYEEASKYFKERKMSEQRILEGIEKNKGQETEIRYVEVKKQTGPTIQIQTYNDEEFEW